MWWTALDAGRRAEWQFDEALRQTVLLAGLVCFEVKGMPADEPKVKAAFWTAKSL